MNEIPEKQLVTLTTDYGLEDYYVVELKASILQKAKAVQFFDVSHFIPSYDITKAAYFVENVYRKFPAGTIHIISVHNHYARKNRVLILKRNGHFFVAPDNGVLSLIFDDLLIGELYTVDDKQLNLDSLSEKFAHIVGYLKHRLPLNEIGPQVEQVNKKLKIEAVVTSSQVRATIIHVDHYDNVIINLTKEKFEQIRAGRKFELYYKQNEPIDYIYRSYSDVAVGEVLLLFNSEDYLELAINMGRASSMFNLNVNETVQINFY